MGATYTRQSSYSDGDVITAAHTNDEFNQLLAAFQASSGHTHDGTANEGGPITKLLGTAITIGDATAGTDIAVTFDGETNDGVITWMEDEDHFKFSDDIVIDGTKRLYFNDEGGEYIHGDGTDLNLVSGADINIPANIGLTFGDDGEKIEGDGTDLTITGNNINLTATADVNIPSGVGLTFATAEKIESDGTDLSITVGSNGDINIPANIGLTFGDDGEKIEGDGTDLTITGNNINLTATADVVIPADVGITFGSGEKIEGDNTDLTITSGAKINLTATSDVHIPNNVGIVFGGDSEKIEGDGTDMTISANNLTVDAAADITLDAGGADVVLKDDGTQYASFTNSSGDLIVKSGSTTMLTGSGANATFAGTITTTGLITGGSLDIDDVVVNGSTIGHTDDTDLITVADGIVTVAGEISVTTLDIGGTNVTATGAELNLMDGGATVGTTAVADGDGIVTNDGGTMRQTTVQTFATYFGSEITEMSNLVTTGALNSGSITSGFGNIDNGTSNITSGGLVKLDVDADADDLTGDSATGRLTIGAGEDLNLYHGGTNSYIVNDTGDLILDTADDIILDANGGNITFKDDGTSILDIANNSTDVELTVSTADKNFKIKGTDGSSAITALDIDMALAGKATFNGDVVVTGDLTITGDDLVMGTNTSGHMLVGDGTNYNPVAISGDISMASNGAVTIANNAVENAMLADNAVDTAEIADNAVTLAKMAGLARGKIIVGDASGDPSALALGSNGQVLQSDGSDLVFGSVSASSLAADNLTAGDAAINLTTTSGNITIDAQDGDSDIIFKGTDGSSDTTFLTLDGSEAGTAIFNNDIKLQSDSSVLFFGADNDISLTHNPDKGLILKNTNTTDDKPIKLALHSGETDVQADDVLGVIEFQAPDEGTGSDATLLAAAVRARSEGDFSSGSNATSLDFLTGSSENASTKATLTSGGRLGVGTTDPLGGIHVKGNGEHGIINIQPGGTSGSTNMAYLRFLESGDDTTVGIELNASLEATNSMDLIFNTLNSNTLAEGFRIQANGSVGIKSGSAKGTNFTSTGSAGGLSRGFTVQHDGASSFAGEFRSEGNNANRFGLILNYGADDNHSSTATAIIFQDGDGTQQGSITSTNGTVNYGAFTANHDVYLPDADKQTGYPYGTLLECVSTTYKKSVGTNTALERGIQYNVQKTSSKMSKAVMGAYACKYATFYMPEDDTQYYLEGDTIPEGKSVGDVKTASTIPSGKVVGDEKVVDNPLHQVYILGDGHILCNNETGNIEIGDFITASSTAGIGMKATETGITCGIAREAVTFSSSSETKLVAVEYGIRQFVAS